ncbi:hypothetical protein [uncultured Actinomyces sp.]|uniref:hypothetical protein n=1 Tax=uncultured Actinomyces sp. TaxID=249061 RepID=UPI002608F47C|nr:hypothetical protein [uncultured Actinomyces sp.]
MKKRARMIVVLVCVFVVLPVVGGLVYSFSVSAEEAARYYAEAVAQGRFEDAMAVESADADAGSGVGRGDAVDLRRGRVSEASPAMSVTRLWMHTNPDGNGRQGVTIDFTADGRSTSRVIYLERSGLPRPYIGSWRVVSSAARQVTVSADGYASDLSIGGVSLGDIGATKGNQRMIPPVTDDLWHFAGGGGVVYAYPGVYDISVTRISEYTDYVVDSVPGATTINMFDDQLAHHIDISLNEETKAWQREQFVPLLESCIRGESPEQALCPDLNVADVESIDVGEVSDSLPGSLAAYNITVTTREHRIWLDVRGAVCFDEAGERYIVFTLLQKWVDGRQVR